ncbi:MAG: cyclic nucleotide-binding domain-containing protein [Chloroflexota bacterium]
MIIYGGAYEEVLETLYVLQHLEFLSDIPPQDAAYALTMACEWVDLQERQDLFQQDQPLEKIFVLLEGSVYQSRVENDDSGHPAFSLRRTCGPGAVLGKYDLLYRNPHSLRTRGLEPCRLLAIDATAINRLIFQFPELRNQIAPLRRVSRMRTMPFFFRISLNELSLLADVGELKKTKADELVYGHGESLDQIYFVSVGQVKLIWGDGRELWVGNGSAFGFCEERRSPWHPWDSDHRAISTTDTELLIIPRRALFDIANLDADQVGYTLRQECQRTIQRLTIFRNYSELECDRLLGYMSYYHIAGHHHLIMQQGEIGDSMWVLMPNRRATVVALNKSGQEVAKSQVAGPTYFSEAALRVQRYLEATVDAEPDSEWLRLHWRDFRMFLHEGSDEGEALIDKLTMTVDVDSLLGKREVRQLYPWLEDGERLVLFRKRHWIALVGQLIGPFFASFISVGAGFVLTGLLPLTLPIQLLIWFTIAAFVIGYWLWGIADYLNDFILVTNRRIVRQEKVILINELRQSSFLRQIQNVDVNRSFLGSFLGYGVVNIQTAGSGGAITFERVGDPDEIRDRIFEERASFQMQYQAESKKMIQNVLEERLGLTLQMPSRVRLDADSEIFTEDKKSLWDQLMEWLEPDLQLNWNELEKVEWHKHWVILVRDMAGPLFTILLSLISAVILFSPLLLFPAAQVLAGITFAAAIGVVGIAGFVWMLWVYIDWRNDKYIVTVDSIVDVEKKPFFFAEERRTAQLDNIENVQLRIAGPINFIFNYGNVELQTAAADGDFTFDYVPNPRAVAEEIRRRIDTVSHQQERDRARARAEELPNWFETYNRLDSERDPTVPGGI